VRDRREIVSIKELFSKYMKGATENYFSFKKHGFMGERTFDPVYNCEVHKEIGCSHVDGMLCDMKTCDILQEYRSK